MMEQRCVSDWRKALAPVGRGRQRARVGESGEGYVPAKANGRWRDEGIHSLTEGVGICKKWMKSMKSFDCVQHKIDLAINPGRFNRRSIINRSGPMSQLDGQRGE